MHVLVTPCILYNFSILVPLMQIHKIHSQDGFCDGNEQRVNLCGQNGSVFMQSPSKAQKPIYDLRNTQTLHQILCPLCAWEDIPHICR